MEDDSKTVETLGINENDAILIEGKKSQSYELIFAAVQYGILYESIICAQSWMSSLRT